MRLPVHYFKALRSLYTRANAPLTEAEKGEVEEFQVK
jgi:hypothetical protein